MDRVIRLESNADRRGEFERGQPSRCVRAVGTRLMPTFRAVRVVLFGLAITVGTSAVSVLGETVVSFELGLGGDNHSATCAGGPPPALFTGHNPADAQTFSAGTPITWSATLSVQGTHAVTSGSYETPGVANFVFDVELHKDTETGPLVQATFYSTMNAGGECPLAATAFPYAFSGIASGPVRIIDPAEGVLGAGPGFNVYMYPTDPRDGRLLGVGAGYRQWIRTGPSTGWTVAGVGKTQGTLGDPTFGCLGQGPVCEGQISNLAAGTYVLKLIPGRGVNVLRGDVNLAVSQSAFAVAADRATGDTIAFKVCGATSGADFDGDSDVDLTDFLHFQECFNGPNRPYAAVECNDADVDCDHDVDLADFLVFQACFNGPNRPPACY